MLQVRWTISVTAPCKSVAPMGGMVEEQMHLASGS